ncbi:hypothetical protein HLH36_12440 [Gluconacetobacter aggeris]|uniref:MFS transporter n=1 Tax=Gluconacetobacter aggeris TaxID=1286186 RepID=A0A7W4IU87_9PROT|nr:hypothetical protein [Gluconacetobacter aggeris]MBB2169156.1 hypothetical protein [Gluconacetobacter aggeris]
MTIVIMGHPDIFALFRGYFPKAHYLSTTDQPVWHAEPSVGRLLITQFSLAVFCGLFFGAYSTVVAEVFEPGSRTTVLATVHNMTVMLVGGTSQATVTWLLAATGSALASGLYVAGALLVATAGAGWLAAERHPARRMAAPAPEQAALHV